MEQITNLKVRVCQRIQVMINSRRSGCQKTPHQARLGLILPHDLVEELILVIHIAHRHIADIGVGACKARLVTVEVHICDRQDLNSSD